MFRRKTIPAEPCSFCDRPIKVNQKVCSCGSATPYMDFAERTRHEVETWRRMRDSDRAAS